MKCISVTQMRQLEQKAVENGISGFAMMECAGKGAAAIIAFEAARRRCRRLVILTGKGNNAGDGLVVAANMPSLPVVVVPITPLRLLTGDAALHRDLLPSGVTVAEGWENFVFRDGDMIVDAMLGTGFHPPLRRDFSAAVAMVNNSGLPVISLDLPSGLSCLEERGDECVAADMTITFGLPKGGLFSADGALHCGIVKCVPIGLPDSLVAGAVGDFSAFFAADARNMLRRLPLEAYKNRSRVLVCAGSAAYPGAAVLNVSGAMRAGGSFVRLAAAALPVGGVPAALVVHRMELDSSGCFGKKSAAMLKPLLGQCDAVVAGSGWSCGKELPTVLDVLLDSERKVVLDADGLNCLARCVGDGSRKIPVSGNCRLIMTPHIGEALRLFDACRTTMPADRREACAMLAELFGATVVLKGPQTVIADNSGRLSVNSNGTPALGICGSGDVLSGVIGALAAGGMECFDAACLGVFLHGAAGDVLPRRGLVADDLPQLVRDAMFELSVIC